MRNVLGLLAGYTLLLASPLAAQENRAWPERTFVTIDVPFQPLNNDFSESLSFADTLRKSESVTFVADYGSTRGALFDVGAGIRLANHVGVGLTSTSLKFDQALITEVNKTVVGFNVSADITWTLASHLGVGTVTRYSRAKLTLDPGAESAVSRAIELHAGGLQIGGGIRLLF